MQLFIPIFLTTFYILIIHMRKNFQEILHEINDEIKDKFLLASLKTSIEGLRRIEGLRQVSTGALARYRFKSLINEWF